MSEVSLTPSSGRAGHLVCVCVTGDPGRTREIDLVAAATIFGLTVFAQAMTAAVLPLSGVVLAPSPAWAAAPYALTLVGAAAASLPAAALTDLFGRRATLALGASLGLAGGAISARGFAIGHFWSLALGAFWLGAAQGFGFFHRHAPITAAANRHRALAIIFAAGCVAALAAPAAIAMAQAIAGPLAPAAALAAIGVAQVAIVALALLSDGSAALAAPVETTPVNVRRFAPATLAAAVAWFGMARLMGHAAPAMALCGLGAGVASAVIANHILWMYAPAAAIGLFSARVAPEKCAAAGVGMIILAVLAFPAAGAPAMFAAVMAFGGAGWSLTMLGATAMAHENGRPSSWALALHDGALFCGAVLGAISGRFSI